MQTDLLLIFIIFLNPYTSINSATMDMVNNSSLDYRLNQGCYMIKPRCLQTFRRGINK